MVRACCNVLRVVGPHDKASFGPRDRGKKIKCGVFKASWNYGGTMLLKTTSTLLFCCKKGCLNTALQFAYLEMFCNLRSCAKISQNSDKGWEEFLAKCW